MTSRRAAQVKQCALEVEIMEERVDAQKDRMAASKAAGEVEMEEDKAKMVELLNERAAATEELEKVLVQLSNDPEMKNIQEQHETEKAHVTKRSMELQVPLTRAVPVRTHAHAHALCGAHVSVRRACPHRPTPP